MNTTETVSSLNLMTLGIVLLVLIVAFAMFMRKRSNRHPDDAASRAARDREILKERDRQR